MKIDTNTPVAVLCEQLKSIAQDNIGPAAEVITESADRLELLDIENTDLRLLLSIDRRNANFWQQKATEAMNRIKRFEEAGDAMAKRFVWDGVPVNVDWRKAKEAKP